MKNIHLKHPPQKKTSLIRDLPGGSVVKISLSNAAGWGSGASSIPGGGAKIPHAFCQKTET